MRLRKTQISLDIHQVWSEHSLSARRSLRTLATFWAHIEVSDQTGRMPKLIWVFAGRTGISVGFVLPRLKCSFSTCRRVLQRVQETKSTDPKADGKLRQGSKWNESRNKSSWEFPWDKLSMLVTKTCDAPIFISWSTHSTNHCSPKRAHY